ncbi:unnamed protein product [Closterium sp. NIES-53]
MHSFDAKLAASDANTSGRVYPQRFVAISLPAESPPSVTLPAESPPPVSLPAESPPAVFLPAESAPAVPLPAESPPSVSLPAESPPPLSLPTEPSVSLPAESPPAVSLPDESAPAVSLPAESASAVSLPAESAPAVSLPAESPPAVSLPAVSLPTESPPAVSLPADSPPAVSLPAESPLAVSLPAESPPPVPTESPPSVSLPAESPHVDRPPPDGNGPLVAFHRAFASLVSFQRKGRVPFANVATFNFDPSVTSSAFAATHFKLLSLPVPLVPEKLTWRDAYPTWVNESRASCSKFPEPSYPDWLTSIHAIVAHVPCDEPSDSWAKDVRWLHHLLTITNFVIRANRTWLPVVLLSACRPPPNLFHCSRLATRKGDTWLYNLTANDMLTRVQPLGSCAMAQPINSNVSANQRVAYATVLHSSDQYVCGAIVLGHSIRRTGSKHELVALVSKEIREESKRGLKEAGWTVKEIKRIRNPHARKGTYNEWNYSKLRLWQQTEYTKLLFIDSDLLLLTSVDFLFSYPEISARGNAGTDFNSGVMVLEPSDCTFDLLIKNLKRVRSANGGDQGFLNNVFTWWHRLPDSINTLKPVWGSDPVKKQAVIDMKSRGGGAYTTHSQSH